jgi:CBS domain-containing protein
LNTGSFSHFSPPYAAQSTSTDPLGRQTADWGEHDSSGGWSAKKIGLAALALGGAAAGSYVLRRRMRKKTAFERFMDASSDYRDMASDFASVASEYASGWAAEVARQRNPAWWAALAAAALPIAYYAWPSSKPTYRQQAETRADDVAGFLQAFGDWLPSLAAMRTMSDGARDLPSRFGRRMPSADDFEMPSGWRMPSSWNRPSAWSMPSEWSMPSDWSVPGDWSMKPDVVAPVGLLAFSALALYLARRAVTSPRKQARIGDVMTRKPRVIQPNATVADAAAMMRKLDVGSLPVCDGSRLVGMVTDRDITTRSTADGRDPHLTPVRDVMSPGVAWATEDDPVDEAARIMREHRIRRLPIVDDRHSLVGVVSLGDLATDFADDQMSGQTLERISE